MLKLNELPSSDKSSSTVFLKIIILSGESKGGLKEKDKRRKTKDGICAGIRLLS